MFLSHADISSCAGWLCVKHFPTWYPHGTFEPFNTFLNVSDWNHFSTLILTLSLSFSLTKSKFFEAPCPLSTEIFSRFNNHSNPRKWAHSSKKLQWRAKNYAFFGLINMKMRESAKGKILLYNLFKYGYISFHFFVKKHKKFFKIFLWNLSPLMTIKSKLVTISIFLQGYCKKIHFSHIYKKKKLFISVLRKSKNFNWWNK